MQPVDFCWSYKPAGLSLCGYSFSKAPQKNYSSPYRPHFHAVLCLVKCGRIFWSPKINSNLIDIQNVVGETIKQNYHLGITISRNCFFLLLLLIISLNHNFAMQEINIMGKNLLYYIFRTSCASLRYLEKLHGCRACSLTLTFP